MSNEKKNSTAKKLGNSFVDMFKRLFVPQKNQKNVLEEEALQTPLRTILKNFFRNKLGILGMIVFVAFLLFAFVGSAVRPLTETYTELTNANLRPGTNYLNFPKDLKADDVVDIVSGVSFSVALKKDGSLVVWGTEPNLKLENVSGYIMDIPEEVKNAHIVKVGTGGKHVMAIDDQGNFYGWGYYAHGQTIMPDDVKRDFENEGITAEEVYGATVWSGILGSDKDFYQWGSTQTTQNFKLTRAMRGHIEKLACGDNNIAVLLDDGTISILGEKASEYYNNVPEELTDGSVQVVDIASTNRNVLALDSEGNVYTWGASMDDLLQMPKITGDVKAIEAGYKHFVVLMEDGSIVTWGANDLGQLNVPKNMGPVKQVFTDYFQNYAIGEDGNIYAWGNKGYILGSDEFGRDMLSRLIHGGRVSLTVGFIALIISTVIALVVGLASGYFGGWVDHVLMRVADIFSAIPFYPIAITLNFAIGSALSESQRLYLIMVVLGVLGWMGLARLVRAQLLVEREKDFVLAAKALGIRQNKIMWRHILPNVFNLVIVNVTLGYASYLLSEAGLSFLGFGVSAPTPSWGNMLTSAQDSTVIQYYWWRWFVPGMCVVLSALSANLIGDALREAMDPRENER